MSDTENPPTPSVASVLPGAFLLTLTGGGGLFWVVTHTLPTVWPRWLFFFCLTLASTGIALPFAALLNRRFSPRSPVTHGILLRQAFWFGIYMDAAAWLQLGRVLTTSILLLLAVGLGVIEYLLRLRERARWKPREGRRP